MEINDIFNNFKSNISKIQLFQRAIKANTEKEIKELNEFAINMKKQPKEIQEIGKSLHNLSFKSAIDGNHIFYDFKKISIEENYQSVIFYKNKQYMWLLAEAYEEFEKFIEKVYAFIGFKNNNLWPLVDYGKITLPELNQKDYVWFLERAKNKQGTPQSILSYYRNNLSEIAKVESKNALKINLKLAIILIENLRHIIVHNHGIVENKDDFINNTLKKAGLDNNKKPKQEYIDFIHAFFATDKYDKHIFLLERETNPEIPIDTHINIYEMLIGYLLSYSQILVDNIEKEIGTTCNSYNKT